MDALREAGEAWEHAVAEREWREEALAEQALRASAPTAPLTAPAPAGGARQVELLSQARSPLRIGSAPNPAPAPALTLTLTLTLTPNP